MQGGRLDWLDVARGIGIVLVVAGHAERGIVSAGIATSPLFGLLDLALYTFHMPLFMLLAGINVPGSLKKGTGRFVQTKSWTVAYPYLLWSVIQGSLLAIFSGLANNRSDWARLATIGWEPMSPFWFLYALFVFMMLAAFVRSANVLVILAVAGLVLSGFMTGESLWHQMAYMLSFFVAGILGSILIRGRTLPVYTGPILMLAWVGLLQIVPAQTPVPYLTPWSFPAAVAGIGMVLAFAQAFGGALRSSMAALGEASMSIYVMHIMATAGTRIILVKLDWQLSEWVYFGMCTGAGVLIPFAAHHAMRSLGWLPIFGLARPTGRTARLALAPGAVG